MKPEIYQTFEPNGLAAIAAAIEALRPSGFFGPEFMASIAGAIVGGLIAACIQALSFREQRRRQSKADQELKAALAFSVLSKISRAYTTIHSVKSQIDSAVLIAIRRGQNFSLAFQAFSSDPPRISFTSEEVALIRSTRDPNIIQCVMDLPHIHDMYIDNMALVRDHKIRIAELQDQVRFNIDGSAVSTFSGKSAHRAKMSQKQADQIICALLGYALRDLPNTKKLFSACQAAVINLVGREHIGLIWHLGAPSAQSQISEADEAPSKAPGVTSPGPGFSAHRASRRRP